MKSTSSTAPGAALPQAIPGLETVNEKMLRGLHTQFVALAPHHWFAGQSPHEPWHPSSPQMRPPAQDGVQVVSHRPDVVLHVEPAVHVPQAPPHPSGPQLRPPQLGAQPWHMPVVSQV
jgi:hypothetical protein